jgi:hypothetical protein
VANDPLSNDALPFVQRILRALVVHGEGNHHLAEKIPQQIKLTDARKMN